MRIDHVLAVVCVSNLDFSLAWYERLFGAPPTNIPMPGDLAEWQVTKNGWLQLHRDPDRAGSSFANFAVDDLDGQVGSLRRRHIEPGEIITANKDVQLSSVEDPDGNTITFIGNFRENY